MVDKTVVAAFLWYSPNPTWLANSDGRCVYANQALREISAISADQLGDSNWLELVTDEDRDMSLVDACEAISRPERPKELTIRTSFFDDNVCFEVQNNGGCITDLEHLLEAVFANESRGTVVALAVSRSIIEAQGGTLEATRLEGEATCVRIELPRLTSP
jgi:nitrogen-specific signal transduction histidine kinase